MTVATVYHGSNYRLGLLGEQGWAARFSLLENANSKAIKALWIPERVRVARHVRKESWSTQIKALFSQVLRRDSGKDYQRRH